MRCFLLFLGLAVGACSVDHGGLLPTGSDASVDAFDGGTDSGPDAPACTEGETRTCGMRVGLCEEGTETCEDGRFGPCVGAVEPATEICDAAMEDEDCDGSSNEECECIPGTVRPCGETEVGACTLGESRCGDDGRWSDCISAILPTSEVCDGLDNDCDGIPDDGVTVTFFIDMDGDGHGNGALTTEACSLPAGHALVGDDCDDNDGAISPTTVEVCDGKNNDCDAFTDEAVLNTFYRDMDGDTYGTSETTSACTAPPGFADRPGDCDDSRPDSNPGAPEICDGFNNDCDGLVDEGVPPRAYFRDDDGDGYGVDGMSVFTCGAPMGFAAVGGDCDDGNGSINPGEAELCDLIDNNCDGTRDESGCGSSCTGVEFGGHVYQFCATSRNWFSAADQCRNGPYELVTISDDAEQTWVLDTARSFAARQEWWIGLYDAQPLNEGFRDWTWLDGAGFAMSYWHPGEPNNFLASEDCVVTNYPADATRPGADADEQIQAWNDAPCLLSRHYICEEQ